MEKEWRRVMRVCTDIAARSEWLVACWEIQVRLYNFMSTDIDQVSSHAEVLEWSRNGDVPHSVSHCTWKA